VPGVGRQRREGWLVVEEGLLVELDGILSDEIVHPLVEVRVRRIRHVAEALGEDAVHVVAALPMVSLPRRSRRS
jgi:hypothetical protein